jgi:hypothetical protein
MSPGTPPAERERLREEVAALAARVDALERKLESLAGTAPDPVALLNELTSDQIRERLKAIEAERDRLSAERSGLRTLLFSVRSRERRRRPSPAPEPQEGEP